MANVFNDFRSASVRLQIDSLSFRAASAAILRALLGLDDSARL
jgi:hypothetical protein